LPKLVSNPPKGDFNNHVIEEDSLIVGGD